MRMSDVPRRFGGAADSRLDRAIDRAVRDMVQVDPRPGFRSRVLAHLDREPARSPMFMRFALAAGALAVLLLAVMVMMPDRRSELPPSAPPREAPPLTTTPRAATSPGPPVAAANMAPPKAATRIRQAARRGVREPIPMPRVANVFGSRNAGVAATSADADAVWPAPGGESREDRPGLLPSLVIPVVEPPAPIAIAPLNPRGPGGGRP